MTTLRSQPPAGEQALFSAPSFPELYESALVPSLFDPWVAPLLEDVALSRGERVLDLACGTGIVARRAKERLGGTGTVVGVDVNPQMLAVARRVEPNIDWREGDAGALPLLEGERFDVVVCQQGVQFFPDLAAAAREMRRALASDGRLALSTWRPDEEFALLRQLRGIAERHVGAIADRRHGLGEVGLLEAALLEAGFRDIRSRRYTRIIRFPDGLAFVRLNAMALVSMSTRSREMTEEERQRVVEDVVADSAEHVRPHMDGAGLAYEIGTNVVLARSQEDGSSGAGPAAA